MFGQLGTNESGGGMMKSSPVQVPGTTWSKAYLGSTAAGGIKTDGTLWMWGSNSYGQLGQNSILNSPSWVGYSSPVQIPGTTWSNVGAGGYTTYAKKTDGTFWAWGRGDYGNLGLNSRPNYSSPVQITGAQWATFPSIGQGTYTIGVTSQ